MWDFLNRRFEEVLGAIILALMVSIAFINVLVRYCSSFSFAWSEEITTNLFVWIVLLGTACAFRDQSNLCVSLFYNKLPKALRYICYALEVLLSTTFFGFLAYTGILEVIDEIDLERVSDSLELPYWIYSGAVPAFSLLIIFRLFQRVRKDLLTNNI
ncbi:MAG: TRAP transporter small permease [Desulfovibrionaceae bacterium]|nr:TRAP transporter small permease [Desulfovibrionaceae bacterium]